MTYRALVAAVVREPVPVRAGRKPPANGAAHGGPGPRPTR
jgi:hypothetical protein